MLFRKPPTYSLGCEEFTYLASSEQKCGKNAVLKQGNRQNGVAILHLIDPRCKSVDNFGRAGIHDCVDNLVSFVDIVGTMKGRQIDGLKRLP